MSDFDHNLFQFPHVTAARDAAAAIIVDADGHYLMQHRDDKPGIFYPGHWGLFGGAMDAGETAEAALRRELVEELGWEAGKCTTFTSIDLGFEPLGGDRALRYYFAMQLPRCAEATLRLGEGQAMRSFAAPDLLLNYRVVPYDAFAIWLHCASTREQGT